MYMDNKTFKLYNYLEEMENPERVVEIDERMAPIISILNRKGYFTYASCSGHLEVYTEDNKDIFNYYPGLYIAFKCNMQEEFKRLQKISLQKFYKIFSMEYEYNPGREVIDYSTNEESNTDGLQDVTEISIIRISYDERYRLKKLLKHDTETNIYFYYNMLNLYHRLLYRWALSLPDKNKRKIRCKKKRYTKK